MSCQVRRAKVRVLDSLGVALDALDSRPVAMVRAQLQQFSGAPLCTLNGSGKSAPDRAALYDGALMRLDFNDSPGTRRDLPSERQPRCGTRRGRVAHADGRALLSALAVAYRVQIASPR